MTRRLFVPVAALALSVALGACGSSTPSAGAASTPAAPTTTSPTGAPTSAGGAAQFNDYRNCLAQHGVTIPQRAPGGSAPTGTAPTGTAPTGTGAGGGGRGFGLNTNDPTVQAAMQACASLRPQFTGQGGGGQAGGGQRGQQFQAYLSCLEDNGVAAPPTTVATTQAPTTAPTGTDAQAGGQRGAHGGGLQGVLVQVRNDPNFATANAKCGVLLPQGGPGAGATTTTTTAG